MDQCRCFPTPVAHRAPTHELTRAHSVLRPRRRIFQEAPQWALSAAGLNALIGRVAVSGPAGQGQGVPRRKRLICSMTRDQSRLKCRTMILSRANLLVLEAISQRTKRLLSDMAPGPVESRDPMVYDLDWDEKERLASWREAVDDSENLPPLLGAAIALLAWEEIEPLQVAQHLNQRIAN